MRALSTTAIVSASTGRLPAPTVAAPAPRRNRLFSGFRFRRAQPSLFHRCLAVHIATAGTLSALR